jgi:hypothetical protein
MIQNTQDHIVLDIAYEKIAFCLSLLAIVTIASTVAVHAKSEVAGGYDTGFARGA